MKKGLVFFLSILLLVSSVYALQTTIKQQYQPGETIIIALEGKFFNSIEAKDI